MAICVHALLVALCSCSAGVSKLLELLKLISRSVVSCHAVPPCGRVVSVLHCPQISSVAAASLDKTVSLTDLERCIAVRVLTGGDSMQLMVSAEVAQNNYSSVALALAWFWW